MRWKPLGSTWMRNLAFLPTARLSFLIEIGLRLALYPLIRLPPSLVRLVLSRPQHFADAQHVFRGPHIHPVGVAETLLVAILGEFQHLGGSVGVERHGVDVLPVRRGQRGRRADGTACFSAS